MHRSIALHLIVFFTVEVLANNSGAVKHKSNNKEDEL